MSHITKHYAARTLQNRCHEPKRSKCLSHEICKIVAICVFTCPNEATFRLNSVGNHRIAFFCLIFYFQVFELLLVVKIIYLLKDFLKPVIVTFVQPRLKGEKQRHTPLHGILKTMMCKLPDALVSIDHTKEDSWALQVIYQYLGWLGKWSTFFSDCGRD